MKASQVLDLNNWVKDHKQQIQLAQPKQTDIAAQATNDLQFKVSVNALRDVLLANGICRKSKSERERDALISERDRYREIVIKLLTSNMAPEWLRQELLTQQLDDEIQSLLKRRTG